MSSPVVVGIDIGGTKTAAAVVDPSGASGPIATAATPALVSPDAVLDAAAAVAREAAGDRPLAAVGVGTAGVVDVSRGTIVSATDSFVGWVGTDVAGGLAARLGVPVRVVNDVDAHALGELWTGAAASARSFLMVGVGTGVGGCVVVDGRPLTGRHHVAGEIAHIPAVGADGLCCPCGRDGHLEAIAAGPAIHRRFVSLGGVADDTRAIVALAVAGDPLASRVVREAAVSLGRTIAGIVTTVDPDLVVVGGGMASAGPLWWDAFEQALRAELVDVLADLPVLPAVLGPDAAIVGAASLVHRPPFGASVDSSVASPVDSPFDLSAARPQEEPS